MEYIIEELSVAYLKNAAASQKAQLLDIYTNEPAKAWMMVREIIRIAPKDSTPYTAIVYIFHKILPTYGDFILSDLEKEGRTNTLLNQCLVHVLNNYKKNPKFSGLTPGLLSRIENLYKKLITTNPRLPLNKRDLPNSLKKIISAWCIYSETFWAFEELLDIVTKSPQQALKIIISLLNRTSDINIITIIAAGPLENLLVDHGLALKEQIQKYAVFNNNMKTALANVWLDEQGDAFYPYWEKMMKDFGTWKLISTRPSIED